METGSLEPNPLPNRINLFSSSQSTEIFSSAGDGLAEQTENESAGRFAVDGNVEEDLVGYDFVVGVSGVRGGSFGGEEASGSEKGDEGTGKN